MPSHPRPHTRVPRHRRLAVVGVTLLAYLAAAVGVPMPQGVAKDLSRPFPCQHHACGCSNAEQCWQRCCCFSREQRLAWAIEYGATPPAADPDEDSPSPDGPDPLGAPASPADPHACLGSCNAGEDSAPRAEPSARDVAAPSGPVWVIGALARACRGDVQAWVWLGAVWPACARVSWSYDWCLAGLVPTTDDCAPSRSLAPDPHPPRWLEGV